MPINRWRPAGFAWITSLLTFVSLIAACGGGGGGGNNNPPPVTPSQYSVGGTATGIVGSVVLQNNGIDNLTVSADGTFTFNSQFSNSSTYNVTVLTQPAGQFCGISNGSGTINNGNIVDVSMACGPAAPAISISGAQVKLLRLDWADVVGESEYRLMEDISGTGNYVLRGMLAADATNAVVEVFLPDYTSARYMIQACDTSSCIDSNEVSASAILADAVGYAKSLAPESDDSFGGYTFTGGPSANETYGSIALSADGNTLVVGAALDDSDATGVDGDPNNNNAPNSGAAFVFARIGPANWVQQAYIKASNTEAGDAFGVTVGLSGDGNLLVVGAGDESSGATGVNGDETDNSAPNAGAAYVFIRDAVGVWSQAAYLKPEVIDVADSFGSYATISEDGSTLLIGALTEDSSAAGVNGNADDNATSGSGAAYVFSRDNLGNWTQQAYIKASNPEFADLFGWRMALSATGSRAAISAYLEDSAAAGANGNQADNSATDSGAVYIFDRDGGGNWSQAAYIKASNTDADDRFGTALDISDDGTLLIVGAPGESSSTTGVNGTQVDNSFASSGATYIFVDDGFGNWSQQAYIKQTNTDAGDRFGTSVSFASLDNRLAVGANMEDSIAIGIDGDLFDNMAADSGAIYLFDYDGTAVWSQSNYLKAPNTDTDDRFGSDVVFSADGGTLVTVAPLEDAASTTAGDSSDDSAQNAGAAYIY